MAKFLGVVLLQQGTEVPIGASGIERTIIPSLFMVTVMDANSISYFLEPIPNKSVPIIYNILFQIRVPTLRKR